MTVRYYDEDLGRNLVCTVRIVGVTLDQVDGDDRSVEARVQVEVLPPDGTVRPRRSADAPEF